MKNGTIGDSVVTRDADGKVIGHEGTLFGVDRPWVTRVINKHDADERVVKLEVWRGVDVVETWTRNERGNLRKTKKGGV